MLMMAGSRWARTRAEAHQQRRLRARLEKPIALRRAEPRSAFQSCRNQIDAPHFACPLKTGWSKRNSKNENCKYAEGAPSRGGRVL
jgi:hypothetical protein